MSTMPTESNPIVAGILPKYELVRQLSLTLCETLETEDFVVQSMPDASPIRWHLAHTTWFFETFVLKPFAKNYLPANPAFEYLFNSYYNGVGEQFPRSQRGLLTRPTVSEVFDYRRAIDQRIEQLLVEADMECARSIVPLVELGLHHEQQHQELMLTDVKHMLSQNPLFPVYRSDLKPNSTCTPDRISWHTTSKGIFPIGHGDSTFAYDNETPRHEVLLGEFQLAERLITNGEYLQFIDDDGYRRPELWLSLGWNTVRSEGWRSPLYWIERKEGWHEFTLAGLRPLEMGAPVTHVSYFEADAFARWQGGRLPLETEWEVASTGLPIEGNFVDNGRYQPIQPTDKTGLKQMFGDAWEWTSSPYMPYPGYRPAEGAIGEYNGKFMCNQYVLRGGSCATSKSHIRHTYRNFFPPEARWQFTGIRLAR